ncbi:hypothetical protein HOU26_gp41 [Escherichia phage IMM-002]|uniref:Uncharacterized protein n=1 Tax=Escherichia phage IMM-002 TaxID=2041760 RepID=A0A384WW67_9CAUD|nr:hypothetical protein HOU26_gp41 [Escherichia phage IMM-002]ATI17000.1 hypothetical protein [Escherichia phage IMM-002]
MSTDGKGTLRTWHGYTTNCRLRLGPWRLQKIYVGLLNLLCVRWVSSITLNASLIPKVRLDQRGRSVTSGYY